MSEFSDPKIAGCLQMVHPSESASCKLHDLFFVQNYFLRAALKRALRYLMKVNLRQLFYESVYGNLVPSASFRYKRKAIFLKLLWGRG